MQPENKLTDSDIELIEKAVSGNISLRKIDEIVGSEKGVNIRRKVMEKITNTELTHIQNFTLDVSRATKRNIENMIGAIQIPLGVAGPIKINGEYAKEIYYLPLATTEGALVASTNRGCSAITNSGGSNVRIFKDVMTRAPVFKFENVTETKKFIDWIRMPSTFLLMKEKAEKTTNFGKLLSVETYPTGNTVYLRFLFDTKDAMGMNMVTIATEAITHMIQENYGVNVVSLSGNMCIDKKPSSINSILGRGKTIIADITIPRNIVENKLKCTPEAMVEVNYRKNLLGSLRAGSLGFNAHAANIIAAIFLACGQDAAHVVEGSTTITMMELTEFKELYCSVTLPALPVGTVGGGTGLGTQMECLKLLKVTDTGNIPGSNAKKFAEIIASAVLAGEISLIAAQAAGHLARAHAQLGR